MLRIATASSKPVDHPVASLLPLSAPLPLPLSSPPLLPPSPPFHAQIGGSDFDAYPSRLAAHRPQSLSLSLQQWQPSTSSSQYSPSSKHHYPYPYPYPYSPLSESVSTLASAAALEPASSSPSTYFSHPSMPSPIQALSGRDRDRRWSIAGRNNGNTGEE